MSEEIDLAPVISAIDYSDAIRRGAQRLKDELERGSFMFRIVTIDRLGNLREEKAEAFSLAVTAKALSAIRKECRVYVYDPENRLVAALDFITGLSLNR